ncbi:class I SAM-dependent methyltransferase [Streptomyces sp. NPDC002276]
MLARARERLPDVDFHEADLHRLPLPDDAVDTVVCALALTHVPELAPALGEFARVLRPADTSSSRTPTCRRPTSGRPCPAAPAAPSPPAPKGPPSSR